MLYGQIVLEKKMAIKRTNTIFDIFAVATGIFVLGIIVAGFISIGRRVHLVHAIQRAYIVESLCAGTEPKFVNLAINADNQLVGTIWCSKEDGTLEPKQINYQMKRIYDNSK